MGYQRDWAYSNYKQGKLKGISNLGQVVVPASELYRLQAEADVRAVNFSEEDRHNGN